MDLEMDGKLGHALILARHSESFVLNFAANLVEVGEATI